MGASLPAAARWVESTPRGVSWLGLLYGGNTAGAVFGCLLAGFYLLRVFDLTTATLVAGPSTLAVALASLAVGPDRPRRPHAAPAASAPPAPAPGAWPIYVTIAISGAGALGAEVVWTRLLGLLLGATVYTFSHHPGGLPGGHRDRQRGGLCACCAARCVRAWPSGWCQLLLAGAVAWTAYMLAGSCRTGRSTRCFPPAPWFTFQVDLARTIWTVLPATLLWGASFPLALAAVAPRGRRPGRMVGGIYAANTAGAIVGALAFSLVLIPWIGTQGCERVLIALSAAGAAVALGQVVKRSKGIAWQHGLAAGLAVAGGWPSMSRASPAMLIAYGRRMMTSTGTSKILYTGEGMNSSIAISRVERRRGAVPRQRQSGSLHRALRHAAAAHAGPHAGAVPYRQPRSVLVVGFGAGVTAGSFRAVHPASGAS